MNKEDYVSLEVAKLLKEKGYDEYCEHKYIKEKEDTKREEWDDDLCAVCTVYDTVSYPKPTLYEAQKWLREVNNIHVQIDFDSSQLWGYSLYKCKDQDDLINTDSMFDTFETSLNFGILDALKRIDYD